MKQVYTVSLLTVVETRDFRELFASTVDVHATSFGNGTSTFRLNVKGNRTGEDLLGENDDE